MTASILLQQDSTSRKSPIGRRGVLTVYGFGIKIRMQAGHLEIEDGIGPERRRIRLAKIGHNLKRLVCISEDGFATLAALKWISDVGASFVMLNRNGKVLFTTGPNAPSDVRLRRAQALAHTSGAALRIARELIDQKLAGQEQVARYKLNAPECAEKIHCYRSELAEADDLERVRLVESRGAALYWSAFRNLPIGFPTKDQSRLPLHWRVFGTRVSPLTGSPRLAVNPANAILNYLYSLALSEGRLAAVSLGLEACFGFLHVDTKARDSLACDLMEPVRPQVDAFLLDWIMRETLKREWFFERADGNCRLMAPFAAQLSETAPMWGRAVAPFAEWVTRALWSSSARLIREPAPPTRLTQRIKREVKGAPPLPPPVKAPLRENLCPECGRTVRAESTKCAHCAVGDATKHMLDAARKGRQTANGPEAQVKRANTQRKNALAQHAWKASDQPAWLRELPLSPKSKTHVRSLMHGIVEFAMWAGILEAARNPISLVQNKGAMRRTRKARSLTVEQFHALLKELHEPFATLALVCICLGLRISEALALRWSDVDWLGSRLSIRRGIVEQVVDDVKTEGSAKTFNLAGELLERLKSCKQVTEFPAPEDWIFASPLKLGRLPYSYTGVWRELVRAAEAAKIGHLGTHAFRHSYRSYLDAVGTPVAVQQKMMRHADIRTTFNVYGDVVTDEMTTAGTKVAQLVFQRNGAQTEREDG